MGGLERLFMRITPIIMLICFICFGITHTFSQDTEQSVTYITETYYDRSNFQPIENPTEEQKLESLKVYEFDMQSYINGIDSNILKRSINNTIDIATYKETIETFNDIWKDGYQLLDVSQSILNGIILVINSIITPINIILTPLRIGAGILLTGISIVGINITRDTPVIILLKDILDDSAIPLIQPTYKTNKKEGLKDTTWYMDETLEYGGDINFTIDVNFESPSGGQYKQIVLIQTNSDVEVRYIDNDNNSIVVYQSGAWIYEDSRTIHIKENNNFPDRALPRMELFLSCATEITE